MRIHLVLLAALVAGFAAAQQADSSAPTFRPRRWFGDHMVLPANTSVPITGVGAPGAAVTVRGSWGAAASGTVDGAGTWRCELATPGRGGPFEVTLASGDAALVLHDVLAGDVWLCSGQSNMVMQVGPGPTSKRGVQDWQQEVAAADLPQLRMFTVARRTANAPVDDVDGAWQVASPTTAAQFSAVAFFFGRELLRHDETPLGLVVSAWGGTVCEAWTSAAGLADFPEFAAAIAQLDAATAADPKQPNRATVLWNGMIAPLRRFPFTGVIWYQGESNHTRPAQYARLFPAMIADWRRGLGRELPFYFVQIAPYRYPDDRDDQVALLRAAQAAALSLPGTGMVVTLDCGEPADIHPIRKQPVGERLARLALARHYGKPVPCDGPRPTGVQRQGASLRIRFDAADGGLVLDPAAAGFEVAAADGRFVAATAREDDGAIVVSSPDVAEPVSVRYAWSSAPGSSLQNGAGLPAAPFRASIE
ncbi:MAG: sialate O-acetylesterase [Planctomycetes bacterium]|nr:sialate O-acetylesterase [Planctomycetota bacterium]